MTRHRQRPAVGGSSAEVVSIGARHPDYSRLACGQVAAARHKLGLDRADFARYIEEATGWDVLPEGIAAWEDDVIPPGDVLYACIAAAQGAPALALPLLSAVPPAFHAEALAGPWVTSYQFSHDGELRYHADIAHVTAESASHIRAVNHPPEPRSEGRARAFRNEIDAELAGRHLIGTWQNTSDTRYYGAVQLAAMPGESVMHGYFSGVGSDVEVSAGYWKWVRLAAGPGVDFTEIALRDPAELHALVMGHSQTDAPLILAEVREGA